MKKGGFKYAMFEDNYPTIDVGDCWSLKKAFIQKGKDAEYLHKNIKCYYEFPPIFQLPKTRWGADWNESTYPTPRPLFDLAKKNTYKDWITSFIGEAKGYTWICYVELK